MRTFESQSIGILPLTSASKHLAWAVCVSVAFVSLLSLCFTPIWETNDDVGMSMIAHGYGFVAQSSPNLIFSNVLWGHIIQAMPQFGHAFGYTVATTLTITVSCAATLYFILRIGVARLHATIAVGMVFIWPVLFPQFTLNSGLLAVASILGWRVYAETRSTADLILASSLAFFSFLIRDQQFWLVLAVSLPLYPWKFLARDRKLQVAIVLLAMSIAGSVLLNQAAYDTSAWKQFAEFNQARAPYTDFRAGDEVRNRPDVLARHGYSPNDIDLISEWFFVDPQLTNAVKLNAMLTDVGLRRWVQRGFGMGVESLRMMFVDRLWPMLACALLIALISPSRSVFILIVMTAAAVFALGAIGRPGVTRVQYPLCALLLLVALSGLSTRPRRIHGVAALMLVAASAATVYAVWPYEAVASSRVREAQKQMQELPKGTLAVWGGAFPYEAAFPPFGEPARAHSVQLYPMGVTTFAPFSIAIHEEAAGRGFLTRLTSAAGLNLSVGPPQAELLRGYCKEHFRSQLADRVIYEYDNLVIHNMRCIGPQP